MANGLHVFDRMPVSAANPDQLHGGLFSAEGLDLRRQTLQKWPGKPGIVGRTGRTDHHPCQPVVGG